MVTAFDIPSARVIDNEPNAPFRVHVPLELPHRMQGAAMQLPGVIGVLDQKRIKAFIALLEDDVSIAKRVGIAAIGRDAVGGVLNVPNVGPAISGFHGIPINERSKLRRLFTANSINALLDRR